MEGASIDFCKYGGGEDRPPSSAGPVGKNYKNDVTQGVDP